MTPPSENLQCTVAILALACTSRLMSPFIGISAINTANNHPLLQGSGPTLQNHTGLQLLKTVDMLHEALLGGKRRPRSQVCTGRRNKVCCHDCLLPQAPLSAEAAGLGGPDGVCRYAEKWPLRPPTSIEMREDVESLAKCVAERFCVAVEDKSVLVSILAYCLIRD
ncbi:hypothetical protein BCR44DRAFT_41920 [Catenaria anguillulae PL171]|uniref:Uncharacterized protein n=1 Tax=Catenaria anguillulae PL171 TaxID=765915 RepID=A0A1Y2HMR5_9FUNG|nr:hypothetical protein BCR44DRAFT_41920 [Catenaria anguillulae PL171]